MKLYRPQLAAEALNTIVTFVLPLPLVLLLLLVFRAINSFNVWSVTVLVSTNGSPLALVKLTRVMLAPSPPMLVSVAMVKFVLKLIKVPFVPFNPKDAKFIGPSTTNMIMLLFATFPKVSLTLIFIVCVPADRLVDEPTFTSPNELFSVEFAMNCMPVPLTNTLLLPLLEWFLN